MIPAKCGFCPINERLGRDGSAGLRRAFVRRLRYADEAPFALRKR